jgi:hypothetical protein
MQCGLRAGLVYDLCGVLAALVLRNARILFLGPQRVAALLDSS